MKALPTAPASIPEAWNVDAKLEKLVTSKIPGTAVVEPLDGGSASSTTGGTVKLPSLTRAVQVKDTLTLCAAVAPKKVLLPPIVTYPAGSPPLQVTVAPLARTTVARLA